MRIVHLIWSLNIGGAETMLVDIANKQSLTEKVVVFIGNSDLDRSLLARLSPRVEVKLLGRRPGGRNPWYILNMYWILKRLNPDIIHAHLENFVKIISFLNVPRVLTVHETGIKLTRASSKYDMIFCISDAVKSDLYKRYPGISTTTVYNGISISSIIEKSRSSDKIFRIVQVSRLDYKKKGQDTLLRALASVNAAVGFGNVTVDFIGDGESKEYLVSLAKELAVDEWCRFLGQRSRSYVYENLCNYDLLVQPSRFEGFGLTIVEAMVAKVPVLVSNIEGPMEVIGDGEWGYYFRTGDYEDCAKKILSIVKRSKKREFEESRRKSSAYARDKFDVASTARNYVNEYKKVISRSKKLMTVS